MAKEKKPAFNADTVIGTDEPAKTDIDAERAADDTGKEDLGGAAEEAAAPAPGKHPDKGGDYRFEDGKYIPA